MIFWLLAATRSLREALAWDIVREREDAAHRHYAFALAKAERIAAYAKEAEQMERTEGARRMQAAIADHLYALGFWDASQAARVLLPATQDLPR